MTLPASASRSAPLSPAQLAIWMHEQVTAEPALYIEHVCYDLLGPLDRARLETAVRAVLDAHPAFGAQIVADAAGPRVVPGRFAVEVTWRQVPEPHLADVLAIESLTGVGGGRPLCRCLLVEARPDHHVLLLAWHHLVTDGVGIRVFLRDLAAAWSGLPLRPGADMCAANDSVLAHAGGADVRERAERIAERLADLDPQPLPHRPGLPDSSRCVPVDGGSMPGLAAAAVACRVTVPMLLNAAYQRAVGDVLDLHEFLLGCVTAGRTTAEAAEAVGCFVNTVLQRASSDPTDLLRRSARELARALGDQDVPAGAVAARLVRGLRPRPTSFPQLYLSVNEALVFTLDGLDCRRRWIRHAQAKFDVALVLEYTADSVAGTLHHRPAALAPEPAGRLVTAFLTRLHDLMAASPI
jgi:hypothetical protein